MTRAASALGALGLAAALVGLSGGLAGAIEPPVVPVGPPPPDPAPGPDAPMRQIAPCTQTGVMPGSDLRELPAALQLLNMPAAWKVSTGAGVVVAVIDTGVAAQPRLPHLVPGGDYVMGQYGDGLADCDGHGTVVASLIGAAPAGAPLPPKPIGALVAPPPPGAPAPQPMPPPPPPPTVTVTQTVAPRHRRHLRRHLMTPPHGSAEPVQARRVRPHHGPWRRPAMGLTVWSAWPPTLCWCRSAKPRRRSASKTRR